MTTDAPEEFFADLISNVSHANGVFRITFAQQHIDNEVRPVARLLVPANQLQSMMGAIGNAATEIRGKVAAQVDAGSGSAAKAAKKPATKKPATKKPATKK